MIADPLTVQATGDAVFNTVSMSGSKTIRISASLANESYLSDSRLTISHDENKKSKRRRSVVRIDNTVTDPGGIKADEVITAYVVVDRSFAGFDNAQQVQLKRALNTLLSFFMNDPGASTTGTLTYGTTPSVTQEFLNGEA